MAAPRDQAPPPAAGPASGPPPPLPSGSPQGPTSPAPEASGEVLDPEALATCHQLAGRLFPWDITRALELALLKTFCVPSIAALLERSGEFSQRPRKRYDDTGLMVAELLRLGPDSPAGLAVLTRMNRIHGHYAIANDDFLYVLSTFVAEPIRWLERYGWRPLTASEQQATYRFWRRVGQRMGIRAIPASLEELLRFNRAFEATRFRCTAANRSIAETTLAMLLSDWPAPLRPAIRSLLQALPETSVNASLGWPEAAGGLQQALRLALRLRSRVANGWMRLLPPRGTRFYSQRPTPSYGSRFQLQHLGPPPLLERLNRPRWSGAQRRIGLTGGIATGKSAVGGLLVARGLPLLDADRFSREALAPGSPGARAVLARYGARVRRMPPVEGEESAPPELDRAALGRLVFADAAERRWLEALVHPQVRERFADELARLAEAPEVVLMIPLLFEAELEGLCSEVWLVDCEEGQQLGRLMGRDGLSAAEARARIAAQWPLARKRPLADVVIDNRGQPSALAERVEAALRRPGGTDS